MQQAAIEQNICAGQLVRFYNKSEDLAESVTEYIQLGLHKGDGIFVLATPDQWQALKSSLLRKDSGVDQQVNEGCLFFIDARPVLRKILKQDCLDRGAFMELIQNILDRMKAYPHIRAYSELMFLLSAGGRSQEAMELEKLWNEILQSTPHFSLMCSYYAPSVEEKVPSMTEVHSPMVQMENISSHDDEEALYQRIAILEQRYATLKQNYQEKIDVENELVAIKKQLSQDGKLSILGELCAGIAHELNNPLAIIAGSIKNSQDMVARSSDPVSPTMLEVLKRLEYIDEASSRMMKIIRNVLMFARQQDQSLETCDIRSTLQKAIEFMQSSLRFEKIQLQLIMPRDELHFLGDTDAILQAFVNIISNARDALASASAGRPRILTISVQILHDQRIEIAFRDSGIGMDEQTLGKVFYPFFTTKDIGKGKGLGLAISHGIITKHKGQITCDSKPNQGTLVRVILPQLTTTSEALRA